MLIELADSYFELDLIAAIRPAGKKSCTIFTAGQDASSAGFLIPLPIAEVLSIIREGRFEQIARDLAGEAEAEEMATQSESA